MVSPGSIRSRLATSLALAPLLTLTSLLLVLSWSYWPTLEQMVRRWSEDPQYTHGYVVPIFAGVVLWFRRELYPPEPLQGSWLGLLPLLLAVGLRLLGSLFSVEAIEAGSLVPALVGILWLVGGWPLLRFSWPALIFLAFILPWPWQFDMLLTYPLRRVATVCSTFALQTLGVPALARGNIIVINELEVGVVEACSGLGMLMTFFALSTAVAFVIQRPRWDRVIIFLSAVPIGVLMNVARITVTVFLFQFASAEVARLIFHDVAGWVMMPMALGVMGIELWWLGKLWKPCEEARGPVPVPTVIPAVNCSSPADLAATPRPRKLPNMRPNPKNSSCTEAMADRSLVEVPDAAP